MSTPRHAPVAVIIPARNAERSLDATLSSVRHNSRQPAELVVVDDGSTDGTAEVAASRGATVITTPGIGRSGARNLGVASTTAPVLLFLDADDVVLPTWVEALCAPHVSRDVVGSTTGYIAVEDDVEWINRIGDRAGTPDARTEYFIPGTFTIERSVFDQVGGYDESLSFSENTELWMRLTPVIEARSGTVARVAGQHLRYSKRTGAPDLDSYRDRLRAATLILDRHRSQLSDHQVFNYESVASVSAARVGDVGSARQHALAAARARPTRAVGWARLLAMSIPIVRQRAWPDLDRTGAA